MVVYDENIREALSCLADVEWQRRVWAAHGNDPGQMDSFEECVEQLYTDSVLGDTLGRGHLVYSPEIDRALVDLRRLLARIETRRTPDALIEDPAMSDVRRVARTILDELETFPSSWTRATTPPAS